MTIKELRERAGQLAADMRAMNEKLQAGDEWTAEQEARWGELNADYDRTVRQIDAQERIDSMEADRIEAAGAAAEAARMVPGSALPRSVDEAMHRAEQRAQDTALALQAWTRRQLGEDITDDHVNSCRRLSINPNAKELPLPIADTRGFRAMQSAFNSVHLSMAEQRALTTVTGSSGGYTIPEGFVAQLERALLAFGGVRQVAQVIRTASGNDLPWPTTDDTSNKGQFISENTQVSEQDITFGQVIYKAYKASSDLVRVPYELIEDSAFDLATTLGDMLGERIGRIANEKFTTGAGSGSSEPNGIVTAATLGKTAAGAAAITADELIDLQHSVDPAYRQGARWMMHDNVMAYIRKLKDSQNQYLWISGIAAGMPDTLLGDPFTMNQDMASSIATTAKTVLYGQMSKYKVREVNSLRLLRLVERYADYDQHGFVAFMRMDGNLLDAGTAPVKYLQQA
jgi:HK97 family phage major capsid protein